jgi:hypothetical protein
MKIRFRAPGPSGPYETIVHSDMDVEIREAYVGPMLVTAEGETLGVCMRDGGFHLAYQAPGCQPVEVTLNAGAVDARTPDGHGVSQAARPVETHAQLIDVQHPANR